MSRMLESEKAQQKRDQDEKRKSNEFKGSQFDRQIDELIQGTILNNFNRIRQDVQDIVDRLLPPVVKPQGKGALVDAD